MIRWRVSGLAETAAVLAVWALVAWAAFSAQHVRVTNWWDADEYFRMAQQMAAGTLPTRAAPYVYRVGVPWLVSVVSPDNILRGFFVLNYLASAIATVLLTSLFRRLGVPLWARLTTVGLFLGSWIAPARFISYLPVSVDPVALAFLIGGLLLAERVQRRRDRTDIAWFCLLCAVGALVREVMLVVPAAVVAGEWLRERDLRRLYPLLLPVASALVVFLTLRLVVSPRNEFSFAVAALEEVRRKAIWMWPLAWFATFGPVLVLAIYDWRGARDLFASRPHLMFYLAAMALLAAIGGSDTERLLVWTAPVVYLLIARALAARREAIRNSGLLATLILAQCVIGRFFWAVPTPNQNAIDFGTIAAFGGREYAFLNRLFVIDDFHWNLWSSFGSRPFHLIMLGLNLVLIAAMLLWMTRTERRRLSSG